MLVFVIRRIVQAVLVMLTVALIAFMLFQFVGDPVTNIFGQDELAQKIQSETDERKRNVMIREAFKIHQDDIGHIPLHQQALAWGFSDRVGAVQLPDKRMFLKWMTLKSK